MNGRRTPLLSGLALAALLWSVQSSRADLLQFFDGSSLSGDFLRIDEDGRLRFYCDAFDQEAAFSTEDVSWLRFGDLVETAEPTQFHPDVALEFANGDEVYGRLVSISESEAHVKTSEDNELLARREDLRSVTRLPTDYRLLYEGPNGADGWTVNTSGASNITEPEVGASPWIYKDGALQASRPSTLGRKFPLQDAVSVQFDMSWTGFFSLYLGAFAERDDRYDYRTASYRLMLSPNYASLRVIEASGRNVDFGRANVTGMDDRSRANVQFQLNRVTNEALFFLDGELVYRWQKAEAPDILGNAIVFSANSTGSLLRISNLKIATWSGDSLYPYPESGPADDDVTTLINGDRVIGPIQRVDRNTVEVEHPLIALEAPMERVTRLRFAGSEESTDTSSLEELQGAVRVFLRQGGRIAIQMDGWSEDRLTGASPTFSDFAFHRSDIRQLRFNPARGFGSVASTLETMLKQWEYDE